MKILTYGCTSIHLTHCNVTCKCIPISYSIKTPFPAPNKQSIKSSLFCSQGRLHKTSTQHKRQFRWSILTCCCSILFIILYIHKNCIRQRSSSFVTQNVRWDQIDVTTPPRRHCHDHWMRFTHDVHLVCNVHCNLCSHVQHTFTRLT